MTASNCVTILSEGGKEANNWIEVTPYTSITINLLIKSAMAISYFYFQNQENKYAAFCAAWKMHRS